MEALVGPAHDFVFWVVGVVALVIAACIWIFTKKTFAALAILAGWGFLSAVVSVAGLTMLSAFGELMMRVFSAIIPG